MTRTSLRDDTRIKRPRLWEAFMTTGAIQSVDVVFIQGLTVVNKEHRSFSSSQLASRLYIDYPASDGFNHHPTVVRSLYRVIKEVLCPRAIDTQIGYKSFHALT